MMGQKQPSGFDGNPTRWFRRISIVALACAGLCVSAYLTLYQVDVLPGVWDPFFQSTKVLEYLGIPDAALGALAYGAEIILSLIGGSRKWRTMPWTVQAFLVGAWCTLCLVSAAISIAIFILGFREPLAGLHYLAWVRGSGGSAWRALWGMSAGESARG
jgi:hypothetical protein